MLLTSTHLPWIGERTRQIDGAHVALLAGVVNPRGVQGRPGHPRRRTPRTVRTPRPAPGAGPAHLIARMGADAVADHCPRSSTAVREAGHPVIWLTDPMHGNTVVTRAGLKTRFVETIVQEVQPFQTAVRPPAEWIAGGLHLETTPDEVTECVTNESFADQVAKKYTSLCDPRLNPEQAMAVTASWLG